MVGTDFELKPQTSVLLRFCSSSLPALRMCLVSALRASDKAWPVDRSNQTKTAPETNALQEETLKETGKEEDAVATGVI